MASICTENGNGQVIAVERNAKRFKILQKIMSKHCENLEKSGNLRLIHGDFLQLNPKDFPEVEYMVVDPTCSGSGSDTNSMFYKVNPVWGFLVYTAMLTINQSFALL